MGEFVNHRRPGRGIATLLALVLLGVVANSLLTLNLREHVTTLQQAQSHHPDLPCAAIPTRFIFEDPACAQKLVEAMNVTNFKILTNAS